MNVNKLLQQCNFIIYLFLCCLGEMRLQTWHFVKKKKLAFYSLSHVGLPLCHSYVGSVLEICLPHEMLMDPRFLEII